MSGCFSKALTSLEHSPKVTWETPSTLAQKACCSQAGEGTKHYVEVVD